MTIEETLAERGNRYGDFTDHAKIAQDLQNVMRDADGFHVCTPVQKQALTVIADKIARILSGDPNYADNWHDIQGYAKLAEDRIPAAPVAANDNKPDLIVDLKRICELPRFALSMVEGAVKAEKLRRKADALDGRRNIDNSGQASRPYPELPEGFLPWEPGAMPPPENVFRVFIRECRILRFEEMICPSWAKIVGDRGREIIGYQHYD